MFTWDNPNKTARWRHMEQLEQIYMLQPLWVGDLISKDMTRCLRNAGLVDEDDTMDDFAKFIQEQRMVAALFVEPDGVYFGLPSVDPWDKNRDARLYDGPYPVVAHPPCARWGRYWSGGPCAKVRRRLGDDGGCFDAALTAVRRFGGVLEHPEASHAWRAFDLNSPPRGGGWVNADFQDGWTCCVEQGHYGHKARKATWLYANGVFMLPSLVWGPSTATGKIDGGYHTREERAMAAKKKVEWLSKKEKLATPTPFRDLLLSIVRLGIRTTQVGDVPLTSPASLVLDTARDSNGSDSA